PVFVFVASISLVLLYGRGGGERLLRPDYIVHKCMEAVEYGENFTAEELLAAKKRVEEICLRFEIKSLLAENKGNDILALRAGLGFAELRYQFVYRGDEWRLKKYEKIIAGNQEQRKIQ